jgi:hypothetical protein
MLRCPVVVPFPELAGAPIRFDNLPRSHDLGLLDGVVLIRPSVGLRGGRGPRTVAEPANPVSAKNRISRGDSTLILPSSPRVKMRRRTQLFSHAASRSVVQACANWDRTVCGLQRQHRPRSGFSVIELKPIRFAGLRCSVRDPKRIPAFIQSALSAAGTRPATRRRARQKPPRLSFFGRRE